MSSVNGVNGLELRMASTLYNEVETFTKVGIFSPITLIRWYFVDLTVASQSPPKNVALLEG